MKNNLFLRVMALLLTISILAGCFTACRGSDTPIDTDPSTEGQTTYPDRTRRYPRTTS